MAAQSQLQVFQLSTLAELASLRLRWNELAGGVPTRSWEWLEGWWRVYGNTGRGGSHRGDADVAQSNGKELYIIAVFEVPSQLVGIAPWYIEHSHVHGRVLRFLGSGEVCTDYSTILCEPGYESAVGEAIARTLCDPLHLADWLTNGSVRHWDRIDFESVAADDTAIQYLLAELAKYDNLVHRRPAASCWRVELPATWDEYLATLSKSHRKQVRRLDRDLFATGRVKLHEVTNADQFDSIWSLLVRLHQSRQHALGTPGCFSSPRYAAFHQDVARRLLESSALRLQWLEFDGRAVAAEYHLLGRDRVFAYQGGIDSKSLSLGPGQLSVLAGIKQAIEEGRRTFDFLRGDEPYKAHWRARPLAMEDVRVVKSTPSNRVRRQLWVAGDQVRKWIKNGFSGDDSRTNLQKTSS